MFPVDVKFHMFYDDNLIFLIPKLEILNSMADFLAAVASARTLKGKAKAGRKYDICTLWMDMREGRLEGFEDFVRFSPAQFSFSNLSL